MALECLCDFMSEPTFLVEMYVNYDCDVHVSRGVQQSWFWSVYSTCITRGCFALSFVSGVHTAGRAAHLLPQLGCVVSPWQGSYCPSTCFSSRNDCEFGFLYLLNHGGPVCVMPP